MHRQPTHALSTVKERRNSTENVFQPASLARGNTSASKRTQKKKKKIREVITVSSVISLFPWPPHHHQ